MRAMDELGLKLAKASGDEREQFARFALNLLNLPIRNFIIPLPDGRTPYLQRFILDEGDKLLPKDERKKVYLHLIYESDGDRDPHDHPFDFASTIVWGSYREQRYLRYCKVCAICYTGDVVECDRCRGKLTASPDGTPRTYQEGMVNSLRAHQLHKLEVVKGPVVTLVKRGPKTREWGFQTDDGWIHHLPYIKEKFPGAQPTEVD